MHEMPPVIIVKKNKKHHGHHGGAWKVAYADFVTAMMALFIVLWMMNASRQVQLAVGGYFKDPRGTAKVVGSNQNGSDRFVALRKQDMNKLKQDLLRSIHHINKPDNLKNQISITVTPQGLRIELMEAPHGTFFQLGGSAPTPALRSILQVLAPELGKLPNQISIEGHTDSIHYSSQAGYDNWDLSTDRANEARRLMVADGVRSDQIAEVTGYSDREPRLPEDPEDPSNRRVTMIVKYLVENGSEMALPSALTSQSASTRQSPMTRQSPAPSQNAASPTTSAPAAPTSAKPAAAVPKTSQAARQAPLPGRTAYPV